MRSLFFLCAVLASELCFAQPSNASRIQAAQMKQAEIDRLALQQTEWDMSKKLSPFLPLGNGPKPPGGDTPPETAREGVAVDLHHWQFAVLEVIDANNCLLILDSKIYWLENFSTKGLATDDKVFLAAKVKSTGTKDYQSVQGKMTVRKFAFLSKEELEKEAAAEAAEREAKEWPEWRSTAGTTIKAKFIGGAGGVQLQTKDGRKLTVPLSKFVEEDREKLREMINEWRKKKSERR